MATNTKKNLLITQTKGVVYFSFLFHIDSIRIFLFLIFFCRCPSYKGLLIYLPKQAKRREKKSQSKGKNSLSHLFTTQNLTQIEKRHPLRKDFHIYLHMYVMYVEKLPLGPITQGHLYSLFTPLRIIHKIS